MNPTPLVSVVIPAYNSAPYIREAIDSALAQSLKDLEVLVIDDGSTDDTREIVQSYGHPVQLIPQDHKGPAAARNRGIRESHGAFIAFLDSDDRWQPSKLVKQAALLQQRPDVGMVITGHAIFDEAGVRPTRRGSDKGTRLLPGDPVRNIFEHSGVGTPCIMVRREVFDKVGYFDEDLIMSEDDNMWMRITSKYGLELVDEPLTEIRISSGSVTRDILKLSAAFNRHVELLESRYKEIGTRVQAVVPVRMAEFEYAVGRHYLSLGDYANARRFLSSSVDTNPGRLKYRLWKAVSRLPAFALNAFRPVWQARRRRG